MDSSIFALTAFSHAAPKGTEDMLAKTNESGEGESSFLGAFALELPPAGELPGADMTGRMAPSTEGTEEAESALPALAGKARTVNEMPSTDVPDEAGPLADIRKKDFIGDALTRTRDEQNDEAPDMAVTGAIFEQPARPLSLMASGATLNVAEDDSAAIQDVGEAVASIEGRAPAAMIAAPMPEMSGQKPSQNYMAPPKGDEALVAFLSRQSGVTAEFSVPRPSVDGQSAMARLMPAAGPAPELPIGPGVPVLGRAIAMVDDMAEGAGRVRPVKPVASDSESPLGAMLRSVAAGASADATGKPATLPPLSGGDDRVAASALAEETAAEQPDNLLMRPSVKSLATFGKEPLESLRGQFAGIAPGPVEPRLSAIDALPKQAAVADGGAARHGASVARQIADAVVQSKDGQVEVRLSPEELGRVRIVVAGGDHARHVTVWFDRADVSDAARRHADQLRQDLQDAGFGESTLDFRDDPRQRAAWDVDHHAALTDEDSLATAPDLIPPVAAMKPRPVTTDGRLDIRI